MKYVNVMRLLDSNMDLNSAAMNLTFVSVEVGKELDVIRVGDKERHREGEREREVVGEGEKRLSALIQGSQER